MQNNLVMLVEDDDQLRRFGRKRIEDAGYQVEDYSHGLSAFKRLVELNATGHPHHYRLILSDIDMPHMNGLLLAEECAKIVNNTPFILVTGQARDAYPENVREVLIKPFSMGEYKRILDTYAPLKHK